MALMTRPLPREGTWLWLAKIVSGALVFLLLMVHLVVNHLVAQGGLLSYADVLGYYAHPLIVVMEGIFLTLVVAHALLGMRGIALDLDPPPALVRALDVLFCLVGVGAVGYGMWLLRTVAALAMASN